VGLGHDATPYRVRRSPGKGGRVEEGSSSFLEKRTKKLLHPGLSLSGETEAKQIKVFCFFFSKKKSLSF
jgi:hypothetical protein